MMRDENMWGSGNNNDDEVGLPDMTDMPTGRFNPDDLEFESFMFDQGDSLGTAVQTEQPVSGWSAQGGATSTNGAQVDTPQFVGQASAPPDAQPHQTGPMGITGQSVPVPSYLQGSDPGATPFVSLVVPTGASTPPTGTGPLAGASTHAQATGPMDTPPQPEDTATATDTPASTKVGTGPLSARVFGTTPTAPRGTGPLTQRISGAGASGQRSTGFSADTPASYEQPEAQPAPMNADPLFSGMSLQEGNGYATPPAASLAPATSEVAANSTGPFSMSPMPYQNGTGAAVMDQPPATTMGWSDSALSSTEDFSTILIAMRSSKKPVEAAVEVAPAPQEAEPAPVAEAQPMERQVPAWVERAALGAELQARLEADATPQAEAQAIAVDAPQVEEQVEAEASLDEVATPELVQPHMAVDAAPVSDGEEAPAAPSEGSFGTSDLVFESFMFDSGSTLTAPSLPNMEEAMPDVQAMEAEVEHAAEPAAYAEAPAETQVEASAQEQVAELDEIHALEFKETGEDDGAPLPFWLRDTSELNANSSLLQEAQPVGVPEMFAAPAVEAVEPEAPVEEYAEPEPVEPVVETAMAEMAMAEMAMAEPAMQDEPTLEEAQDDDYSDLPPIAPFDFTALNLSEQSESLGFNTEELLGVVPDRHEGMRATTDLAALADLLGMSPASGVLREAPSAPPTATFGAVAGHVTEQEQASAPTQPSMEMEVETPADTTAAQEVPSVDQEIPPAAAQPVDTRRTASWTSTVTSHLSMDTELDLSGKPAEGAGEADGTEKLAVADLDVDPFDFTQLNLEDDEAATGFLDTTKMKMPSTTVLEPAPDAQYTAEEGRVEPFAELSGSVQAEGGDESDGLPGDMPERESELDTSFFLTAKQTGRKRGKSTGRLDEAALQSVSDQAATPDPAGVESPVEEAPAPPDNTLKAKVLQTSQMERDMMTLHNLEAEEPEAVEAVEVQAPGEQMAQVETKDDIEEKSIAMGQAEEAGSPEEEQNMGTQTNGRSEGQGGSSNVAAASMPSRNDMMMSGPLPALDGFDALQATVTANPGDIGAHMALAAAYTQMGDLDTALRVYHRILKKRTVSSAILQLIIEELSDFEAEATGRSHYHQVRGDLYMRQGRFQEAVQEYNKIS